jgi:uncharacterized protein (DUF2384 family)
MTETDVRQQTLVELTRTVVRLMESWGLGSEQMSAALALPVPTGAATFHRYREGQEALPDNDTVLRRAQYMLRISDALRTTYPRNPEMAAHWIRRGHRRMGRRTPLDVILAGDEAGIIAVLSELDCTFSWDMTGSKADYRPT